MLSPNPSRGAHAGGPMPTPVGAFNGGGSMLSPRGRSGSQGGTRYPPNFTSGLQQDPVMARYHSIKRELESVERGRIPAPSAAPTGTTNGLTPGRSASGTGYLPTTPLPTTPGVGHNHSVSFNLPTGGTPKTSMISAPPAVTAAPGVGPVGAIKSLYTTPLTPDPSTKASSSQYHTAPPVVVQNHHSSPSTTTTRSASGGPQVTLPRDQKLEQVQRELEQKKTLLRDAERERELDRQRLKGEENQLHESLRRAGNDRDQAVKRCSQVEGELVAERQTNETLRQRINECDAEVSRARDEKHELERALVSKQREVQHAQDREIHAQAKANEIDSYSSEMRKLQGKISALEDVLKQRAAELEQEKIRGDVARQKQDEAVREKDQLRNSMSNLERSASSATVTADSHRREVDTLKEKLEEFAVNETVLKRKNLDCKDELQRVRESADSEAMNQKNLLRERTRDLQRLELDYVSTCEKYNEAESARIRYKEELAELKVDLESRANDLRDTQTKGETLRILSAQESIVKDELRFEVERLKRQTAEQQDELQVQSTRQLDLEEEMSRLCQDREIKIAQESQIKVLRDNLATAEKDAATLQERHHETNRRLQTAEEELRQMQALRDQVSQLQATVSGRDITIEKLREGEAQLQGSIQEFNHALRARDEEIHGLKQEFVCVTESKLQTDVMLQDAESRAAHLAEAQGQIEALNKIIDNRSADIAHLQVEVSGLTTKNRQLEADVETLLEVRNQVDDLHNERLITQKSLEDRHDEVRNAEQEIATVTAKLRHAIGETEQARVIINSLENQVARQQGQLTDKSQLEQRCRQLTNDLSMKGEECLREKERKEEMQSRLVAKEEAVEDERRRRMEVEQYSQSVQGELSHLQVELGKSSVLIDTAEREKSRLFADIESKSAAAASSSSQVHTLQSQITTLQGNLDAALHTENHLNDKIQVLTRQVEDGQVEAKNLRESRDVHEMAAKRAEEHARTLLRESDSSAALEQRILALTDDVRDRDRELKLHLDLANELREKNRELIVEVDAAHRLDSRLHEMKSYSEKQAKLVSSYEADEQVRTKQLLEKERELGRLREKMTSTVSDFEAEQNRRRQLESRARELELECQRASGLDGQVAGLNVVIQQRTKDIEDERAVSTELRAKLRQVERSTSVRSQSMSMAMEGGDHAKLHVKDEIIASLQAEERRRTAIIEQLKDELHRAETERQRVESTNVDLRTRVDKGDAGWIAKYSALEAELARAKRAESTTGAVSPQREYALRKELEESKRLVTTLVNESTVKNSEIEHMRQQMVTKQREADLANSTMTSKASELAQAEVRRADAEKLLKEKELHLSIATENLMTMEKKRTSFSVASAAPSSVHRHTPPAAYTGVASSGATGSSSSYLDAYNAPVSPSRSVLLHQSPARSATKVPDLVTHVSGLNTSGSAGLDSSATIEQELERWREKRKQQLAVDESRSSEYRSSMRAPSQ